MSIPIQLTPSPGFCIKSTALQPAIITLRNAPVQVPKNLKIFVNLAWDKNVPSPPEGSEEDIQRAMQGQDADELADGWFVPVVVSEGRQDTDKAGKPSLVFDCVYNSSIKTRSLADPEFKIFLIELALQRVEAQTSLVLSRQIGMPNITSKGKLTPRTVRIPSEIFTRLGTTPPSSSSISTSPTSTPGSAPVPKKPLIEEITPGGKGKASTSFDGKLKGILKSGPKPVRPSPASTDAYPTNLPPVWKWAKDSGRLRITIAVPNLTHDLIKGAALDVEPRRLTLSIPGRAALDINLDLSDAEIVANASAQKAVAGKEGVASASAIDMLGGGSSTDADRAQTQTANIEPNNTLMLKRQRDFDVDGATAEWRVADRVLVVFA
ncbi:hypothetical protein AX17_006169 [Amanita inopinata Kibby_2008]|nr:hypothetical protein AX17_006169 [Amanita inopinata Kibby_2008]